MAGVEEAGVAGGLSDVIGSGLSVLFVGYNPGRASARAGHHFAGPGNLFWQLLWEAGLTRRLYTPDEDHELWREGIGLTNLVARMTPSSADLRPEELMAGALRLRRLVERWKPRVVCCLGKDLYRAYAGLGQSAPVAWGVQEPPVVVGTVDVVAPNPSRRSTVAYEVRLTAWRVVASCAGSGRDA